MCSLISFKLQDSNFRWKSMPLHHKTSFCWYFQMAPFGSTSVSLSSDHVNSTWPTSQWTDNRAISYLRWMERSGNDSCDEYVPLGMTKHENKWGMQRSNSLFHLTISRFCRVIHIIQLKWESYGGTGIPWLYQIPTRRIFRILNLLI